MRALPTLALCLVSLGACGSGDSTSFADRFDEDAVASAALQADATPEDLAEARAQEEAQDEAPDEIGIVGGPVQPPRRAFPEQFNRQRAAAGAFLQANSPTQAARRDDRSALTAATTGRVAGTARYEGGYIAEVYRGTNGPGTATVETAGSDFVMSVDLDTGAAAGRSTDGRLVVARAPRGVATAGFDGQVSFDALPGVFDGVLTTKRAKADFAGRTASDAFVGTFEASR